MQSQSATTSATTDIVKRLIGHGLSQAEIQRRTSIPQSRVSRWANGMAPDAADDALRLQALLLEIEAAEGEGGRDEKPH